MGLDYEKIFLGLHVQILVMTSDLTMVAATDAYYAATHTSPASLLNRYVFDVFPENKDTRSAKGANNLSSSLKKVLRYKKPHTLPLQRYDFPLPEEEGGGFATRWWRITNSPILDSRGNVTYITNMVEDVSHLVEVMENVQDTLK